MIKNDLQKSVESGALSLEQRVSYARSIFSGLILGAALLAYLLSPLLPKCDPAFLALAGIFLGIGVTGLHEHFVASVPRVRLVHPGLVATLAIGVGLLLFTFGKAFADDVRIERNICRPLEVRMLNDKGNRQDDAAMFQALGCRASFTRGDIIK